MVIKNFFLTLKNIVVEISFLFIFSSINFFITILETKTKLTKKDTKTK